MGYGYRLVGLGVALAAALVLAAAGCGNGNGPAAETPTPAEGPAEPTSEAQDEPTGDAARFAIALIDAAYEGEEELAELATDRAQSPRVRAHAEDLLEDYERLDPQIDELAEQMDVDLDSPEGVTAQVTSELESVYEQQLTQLRNLDEEEFDGAYLSSLIATHQATIAELERIQPQVEEPEVRQLVDSQLPLIRRQLERAREVAELEGLQIGS